MSRDYSSFLIRQLPSELAKPVLRKDADLEGMKALTFGDVLELVDQKLTDISIDSENDEREADVALQSIRAESSAENEKQRHLRVQSFVMESANEDMLLARDFHVLLGAIKNIDVNHTDYVVPMPSKDRAMELSASALVFENTKKFLNHVDTSLSVALAEVAYEFEQEKNMGMRK